MPVARARLFDELTVQQLVDELAAAWDDQEAHVLRLLADLLEANELQRGDRHIDFYYRHRLDEGNENGTVSYHPLKIPASITILINKLRLIFHNETRMEDEKIGLVVSEDELETLSSRQNVREPIPAISTKLLTRIYVSFEDIFVNKGDIINLLLNEHLRLPQDWREATAPGHGLDQSARIKGGKKSKWDTGLQAFIDWLHGEITADGTRFTLSTVKHWLENEASEYERRETDIRDCDDVYFEDGKVSWTDSRGAPKSCALRTLEHYIRRTKST